MSRGKGENEEQRGRDARVWLDPDPLGWKNSPFLYPDHDSAEERMVT